jgi:hypothetical protein
MRRAAVFACVAVLLAAIDSAAALTGVRPETSPAALLARAIVCIAAGYLATKTPSQILTTALLVLGAVLVSLALSDAVLIGSGTAGNLPGPQSPVAILYAGFVLPMVASAAGSLLALRRAGTHAAAPR